MPPNSMFELPEPIDLAVSDDSPGSNLNPLLMSRVGSYRRKDGTLVRGHYRRPPQNEVE